MSRSVQIREAYRRLWPYLRRYRRQALLCVTLGAAAALGSKANLLLLQPLVERLFPQEVAQGDPAASPDARLLQTGFDGGVVDRWLEGVRLFGLSEGVSAVLALMAVMLAIGLVFAFLQYWFLRLSRMLGVWMVTDLRQDMAEHVMRLGMRYHTGRRLGDLLSRLTADVGMSLRILNLVVEEIIQEPFNILASLTVAFLVAPVATLGVLLCIPLLAWPVWKFGPAVRRRSARSMQKLGDSTQNLTQMFSGIRVVKTFRMEGREIEEFRKVNAEFVHQTERMVKAQSTSLSLTQFLATGGVGIGLGLIALANQRWPVFADFGALTVFVAAAMTMFGSVKRLTKAMSVIYSSMGSVDRVFEVMDIQPDLPVTGRERPYAGLEREIRFENVSFDYGAGEGPALRDVSLRARRGEVVALVGASGAGKSTLLDLVARFYDPTQGRILVDGTDLRELKLSDWLDHLAVVSQHPFLFQTTLAENVRYGRPAASDAEVAAACAAAHVDEFVRALPQGLDTQVGDAGTRLSGGQKQRVTIARALLKNADVLLLDEATSALDSQSERRVQEALANLMQGRTTFVIAHRLSTVRSADRILVLDQGRIVEEGRHEELLERQGIYATMWRLQGAAELLLDTRPKDASVPDAFPET
ncbi:MAG: ABC transporter ATP-binding protein [Planctomycetota bacterium]|nr:MAG: ABC transporter ATP-binding protein [Planctomycetota bacterium]